MTPAYVLAGLLDMGRRELLLAFLSQELLPYASPSQGLLPAAAAAGTAEAASELEMSHLELQGARPLTQVR